MNNVGVNINFNIGWHKLQLKHNINLNKMKIHKKITCLLCLTVLLLSCTTIKSKDGALTIAVSKERIKEHQYGAWLGATGIKINVVNLHGLSPTLAADTLKYCDALLLSGGADVHPAIYGKESDTSRCGFIDIERDAYELAAYKRARETGMPVLGICRGLQYINVMEGGTLFIDLPTDKNTGNLHRIGDEDWSEHRVKIVEGSMLDGYLSDNEAMVASNHHQGIEHLAHTLRPIAYSEDSLIEAFETKQNDGNFLLAVQWHPEWVEHGNTFSQKIARLYLDAAAKYKTSK